MAPRSACRAGRPLLRIRVTGGAPRVRLLLDRGGRRTLPVPAGGVLRVRLAARTRRVTLTAPPADGGQARAAVRVRTRCPRPSARRLAAR
jgi:hypothetical protein